MHTPHRTRSPVLGLVLPLLLVAGLLVAACATTEPAARDLPAPTEQASASDVPVTPPAPEAGAVPTTEPGTAAAASGPVGGLSGKDASALVEQAYRELTGRLYREVPPSDLLGAAWRGVRDESRRQGLLGIELMQAHVDAGSAD